MTCKVFADVTFRDAPDFSELLVSSLPFGNNDCKVKQNTNTAMTVNVKLPYLHLILTVSWLW